MITECTQQYRLVKVSWANAGDWDARKKPAAPTLFETVTGGFLVYQDADSISIARDLIQDGMVRATLVIARSAIISLQEYRTGE